MLNPKIQEALNEQLNFELVSSYLYLSMTAYLESENLQGMANWMRIQVQEELAHVTKFFDFINERDGRVELKDIAMLKNDWDSILEVFSDALEHERKVTDRINKLVNLSLAENDHATNSFLQWFVTEQVEEEASVKTIVDKLRFAESNPVALFMIDDELAKRTYVPPTPA